MRPRRLGADHAGVHRRLRQGRIGFTTLFWPTSTHWVKLGWARDGDATSSETLLCGAKIESNEAQNAVRGISVAS